MVICGRGDANDIPSIKHSPRTRSAAVAAQCTREREVRAQMKGDPVLAPKQKDKANWGTDELMPIAAAVVRLDG